MASDAISSVALNLEHMLEHQCVFLSDKQRWRVESLVHEVTFLRDSITRSSYSPKSTEIIRFLENQITFAAKEVERLIGSRLDRNYWEAYDHILTFPNQGLRRIRTIIDFIKEWAVDMEIQVEKSCYLQDLEPRIPMDAASPKPASFGSKITEESLDEDFIQIKTWLVSYSSTKLETVSIVGMGGIGKTTLAQKIYNDSRILGHFDTHAWVTVSQSHNLQKILLDLVNSTKSEASKLFDESTKEVLYKSLKGRRYLIVMDDVWDTIVWDDLKRLFPNDNNGSRVLITTRLENVATYAANSFCPCHMHFLNESASWNLLCNKVFGKDHCPPELEETGKNISQNCRGLPLALVVIGGLLSKATKTSRYWTSIAENLSTVLFTDDEQCLKTLSLSYVNLPSHLKNCFLYVGIFPEDKEIRVSTLVKLWIAEGFLELVKSKNLEDVAYGYLLDLIDRSLFLVGKQSYTGKIKTCKIHDVVRDFCIREAKKEMFFHITGRSLLGISSSKNPQRLIIHEDVVKEIFPPDKKKLSSLRLQSLFCFRYQLYASADLVDHSLLRVLYSAELCPSSETNIFFNLRFLMAPYFSHPRYYPSSDLFPNLETLIVTSGSSHVLVVIWDMPQLRHVKFWSCQPLSDPMKGENPFTVLENLETLSGILDFQFSDAVLARIPNLKKLKIKYDIGESKWEYYCFNNIVHLPKLESLECCVNEFVPPYLHNLTFPALLKKLSLEGGYHPWEDMVIIGTLPNLEKLELLRRSFKGKEWKPTEEQFLKLKYLLLCRLELRQWTADSVHYPTLQCLKIRECNYLKEIPSGIGDIPTLQSIKVIDCADSRVVSIKVIDCVDSLVASAKRIQEDQVELGNEGFQLRITRRLYGCNYEKHNNSLRISTMDMTAEEHLTLLQAGE